MAVAANKVKEDLPPLVERPTYVVVLLVLCVPRTHDLGKSYCFSVCCLPCPLEVPRGVRQTLNKINASYHTGEGLMLLLSHPGLSARAGQVHVGTAHQVHVT